MDYKLRINEINKRINKKYKMNKRFETLKKKLNDRTCFKVM